MKLGARYLGMWGDTYVERKVYEESYQRSEGIKSQIATDEAVLAEIVRGRHVPALRGSRASSYRGSGW